MGIAQMAWAGSGQPCGRSACSERANLGPTSDPARRTGRGFATRAVRHCWIIGSGSALPMLHQAAFTAPEPFEVAKRDLSGAKVVGAENRLGKQGGMALMHGH